MLAVKETVDSAILFLTPPSATASTETIQAFGLLVADDRIGAISKIRVLFKPISVFLLESGGDVAVF